MVTFAKRDAKLQLFIPILPDSQTFFIIFHFFSDKDVRETNYFDYLCIVFV